ncbi:MAG: lipoprotein insertase outer membrane protein LolB [Cycloclasticus sp.]
MALQLLACSSLQLVKTEINPQPTAEEIAKILAVTNWHLLGRLSVRNTEESWLTKIEWRHTASVDDLTLSTSLGGVVARLSYLDNIIIVSKAGEQERVVPEREMESLMGYSPPLQHLKYWLRGVPNPMFDVQIDNKSPVTARVFEQDGWRVSLERFNDYSDGIWPTKMSFTKGGLRMKLVVDEWL